ncbi:hypothetical protein [Corynebacterium variabile]|uniref:hypothetical protein n=1 Tax=Corynebacterium variabile TaxID=1727 RepID=UPI00289F5492|nr:hypothetical protein [Corynebacterium variabile]
MAVMMKIRRGAVVVALPTLAALVGAVLTGCTDDSDDGTGQTTVTVTGTASPASFTSSAGQPEPTTGEDAVAPALPEPVQSPGEIVGSSDVSTGASTGASTGVVTGGPQLGDACIGANIGVRATASDGAGIICDNYSWQVDVGQSPTDPWVDGQIAWSECIAEKTVEECRAELNG